MYNPIQLTHIPKRIQDLQEKLKEEQLFENIRLNIFNEDKLQEDELNDYDESVEIFEEAVFSEGKRVIEPIEQQFQVIKEALDEELKKNQTTKETKFDPSKFIKNIAWKELEDRITKAFGFRNINIYHWDEKYLKMKDDFESLELNCYTYTTWRYPIDGLVTDKGFYDTTRSINCDLTYSLGAIQKLSAAELTAIFLHEIGHNIDPALVDISYTKSNILSKYLTDREGSLTPVEKKVNNKHGLIVISIDAIIILGIGLIMLIAWIVSLIQKFLFNPEKAKETIKNLILKDKERYSRQVNIEAFADNFARMYGYGPALMSAFNHMNEYYTKQRNSRAKREKERQRLIAEMLVYAIKDVHKTDMHRAYNFIKEYEADLNDPNIPNTVKKQIEEDLNELKKVLDMYLNSSDKFQNQINKMILDELEKADKTLVKDRPSKNIIKGDIKKSDIA
jgi:hypothetical protein